MQGSLMYKIMGLVLAVVILAGGLAIAADAPDTGDDESNAEADNKSDQNGDDASSAADKSDDKEDDKEKTEPRTLFDTIKAGGLIGGIIIFLAGIAIALTVEHLITIRRGVIMPSLVVSYSHHDRDIDATVAAIDGALEVYRAALEEGVEKYLAGNPSDVVYRRFNRPCDIRSGVTHRGD